MADNNDIEIIDAINILAEHGEAEDNDVEVIDAINILAEHADAEENVVDNDDDDNMSNGSSGSSSNSSSLTPVFDADTDDETAEQLINQLENNDPDLTTLCLDNSRAFHFDDDNAAMNFWRNVGHATRSNTQLELLSFHHNNGINMSFEHYQALFEGGVDQNTSIRDIDFLNADIYVGGECFNYSSLC